MSNTVSDHFRWIETSTYAGYHESMFNILDNARDYFFKTYPLSNITNPSWILRFVDLRFHHTPITENGLPNTLTWYEIHSRIVRVGRTSMEFEQEAWWEPDSDLHTRGKPQSRVLLATVRATVLLIANLQDIRPVPIPKDHKIPIENTYLSPDITTTTPIQVKPPHRERPYKFIFRTRHTDSDALAHISNARYVAYIHDVYAAAVRWKAIKHSEADIIGIEISYDRELKGNEDITGEIWWNEQDGTYTVILRKADFNIGAKARLRVTGPTPPKLSKVVAAKAKM